MDDVSWEVMAAAGSAEDPVSNTVRENLQNYLGKWKHFSAEIGDIDQEQHICRVHAYPTGIASSGRTSRLSLSLDFTPAHVEPLAKRGPGDVIHAVGRVAAIAEDILVLDCELRDDSSSDESGSPQ